YVAHLEALPGEYRLLAQGFEKALQRMLMHVPRSCRSLSLTSLVNLWELACQLPHALCAPAQKKADSHGYPQNAHRGRSLSQPR
ncbi:hypothetical protein O6471_23845, partial [Salmonella enterica subsp. enterica]